VKNRTTSGPSQPPCKQNQNKRKVCHDTKKPPMIQNSRKNTHNPPNPKYERKKFTSLTPPFEKQKKPKPLG
jgi:hypothetical protein